MLLAPDLPDDALPTLCGDAGACRLIQLGLPVEAEPIVRDAIRLDSLLGCVVAARLAEGADAGPAALDAAEELDRKVPDDFLLELAPRSIVRALAPRPFDKLVAETAADSGVPHGLLYAVMRQESRFDREAASPAAARGLMQLTLPAAGDAARELNEAPPAYADLYDPARSLRLGAHVENAAPAFQRRRRPRRRRLQRGRRPDLALGRRGEGSRRGAPRRHQLSETRVYFRRVLAHRILYRQSEKKPDAPAVPAASATSGK